MALIKLFDHIYSDSVKQCLSIFNGSIFDGDLMELNELSKDDNLAIFLPYTDLEEEGTFKNIYTNSAFNNHFFLNMSQMEIGVKIVLVGGNGITKLK